MNYLKTCFIKKNIIIRNIKINYFVSPLLDKLEFIHAFFTKGSSNYNTGLLSDSLNGHNLNYSLNQVHSNNLVLCSNLQNQNNYIGDGIISDKPNQNLWVYTADCMPILFADKKTRRVAAIHCGRLGLEKKIIKKTVGLFQDLGSYKNQLIIAIGPSISKRNYFLDLKTITKFQKNMTPQKKDNNTETDSLINKEEILDGFKSQGLISLDLQKSALHQIIEEEIPLDNIEISNKCTYDSSSEFYSWRKTKTSKRQWSFISS